MNATALLAEIERRYGRLIFAAEMRMSLDHQDVWLQATGEVPWSELERLGSRSDADAAGWLLFRSRTRDMLCVIIGYHELHRALNARPDDQRVRQTAEAAIEAQNIGEGLRDFASFWFDVPLGFWHQTDATVCVA